MRRLAWVMVVALVLGGIGVLVGIVGLTCRVNVSTYSNICTPITYPLIQDKTEPISAQSSVFRVQEPEAPLLYRVPVTDEEIDLMARCVMSEASILPYEGKLSVASVIINRVLSDNKFYPDTVKEVILQGQGTSSPQFSIADNGEPTEECYMVVFEALERACFPEDMYWFSSGKPHSWGYTYSHIGNTYFNTESDWEAIINECE